MTLSQINDMIDAADELTNEHRSDEALALLDEAEEKLNGQIVSDLRLIHAGNALPAAVEYELEDLGLIVQDHRPYAHLTKEGLALI